MVSVKYIGSLNNWLSELSFRVNNYMLMFAYPSEKPHRPNYVVIKVDFFTERFENLFDAICKVSSALIISPTSPVKTICLPSVNNLGLGKWIFVWKCFSRIVRLNDFCVVTPSSVSKLVKSKKLDECDKNWLPRSFPAAVL
jgi:hypothetical protein